MQAASLEAAFSLPQDLGGASIITCSGEVYKGQEANSISVACHACDQWIFMKNAINSGNLWSHLFTEKHHKVGLPLIGTRSA
jgi:hypothetical protein